MGPNAFKLIVGWALLVSACADGGDTGAEGTTTDVDLGSGSSTTGPGEPPATSASATASTTVTTSAGMEESSTTTPATESGEMTEGSSSGEPDELSCEAYCDTYLDACTDFSEYANEEHCMDHCGQWPLGAIGETAGDSLGCRSYHVTVASTTDPELHCAHAGPSGDMMCVSLDPPTCDLYCQRYFDYCPDLLNLWESMEMCMSECATWYPGSDSDTGGHTIGCRAYYANLAASDPEANCPNAGPGGGEACVFGG